MRVKDFDHLVLKVRDVERALAFYCGPLGLEPVRVDEWRAGDAPLPSVRISPATIIDLVVGDPGGGSNVDHICLVVEPLDWQQVIDSGRFTVLEGPVGRYGARGEAQSIYVEDPDGNTVELRWLRRLRIHWEIRDDIHEVFLILGCALICRRRLDSLR